MNVSRLEPLGSDVTRPPPGGVEKVGEVCGVVLGKGGGLEGGKVGEHDPVPARHHHVLHLDVAVADPVLVGLLEGEEELEGDPPLLGGCQEGARADAVVQAVLHQLPDEEAGPVGELKVFETF